MYQLTGGGASCVDDKRPFPDDDTSGFSGKFSFSDSGSNHFGGKPPLSSSNASSFERQAARHKPTRPCAQIAKLTHSVKQTHACKYAGMYAFRHIAGALKNL